MKEYIKKLETEDREWRETLSKRKSETRTLRKQKKVLEQSGQELDLSLLSTSQRNFLASQFDCEQFCKNLNKLSEMTVKIIVASRLVEKTNQRLTAKLQKNLDKISERIIDLVE